MKKLLLIPIAIILLACNTPTIKNSNNEEISKPILISEIDGVRIYHVVKHGRIIYFAVSKSGDVSISTQ